MMYKNAWRLGDSLEKGAVLVTGGAIRIGEHICRHLANNGYEPIVHANTNIDAAQNLAKELRSKRCNANIVIGNLNNDDFVAGLIEQAQSVARTKLVGLINNASIFEPDLAMNFTQDTWDEHFRINALVPCLLAQNFANVIGERQNCGIVNILDQRIFRPNPLFFTYGLAKSTLAAATKTMAQAFAPHIRVNSIAPGPSLMNSRQTESDFAAQCDATLLQNGSPPSAIAEAVVFLLEARHITGQILAVDGGQSLVWRAPDIEGINE